MEFVKHHYSSSFLSCFFNISKCTIHAILYFVQIRFSFYIFQSVHGTGGKAWSYFLTLSLFLFMTGRFTRASNMLMN